MFVSDMDLHFTDYEYAFEWWYIIEEEEEEDFYEHVVKTCFKNG